MCFGAPSAWGRRRYSSVNDAIRTSGDLGPLVAEQALDAASSEDFMDPAPGERFHFSFGCLDRPCLTPRGVFREVIHRQLWSIQPVAAAGPVYCFVVPADLASGTHDRNRRGR